MKKSLKLDLDALQVESFDTVAGEEAGAGTVHAFITGICDPTEGICTGNESCLALCSAYCEVKTVPCTVQQLTCPAPSQQTCATACNSGCNTCMSCQNTCGVSCYPVDCYGTCDFQTRCW